MYQVHPRFVLPSQNLAGTVESINPAVEDVFKLLDTHEAGLVSSSKRMLNFLLNGWTVLGVQMHWEEPSILMTVILGWICRT